MKWLVGHCISEVEAAWPAVMSDTRAGSANRANTSGTNVVVVSEDLD